MLSLSIFCHVNVIFYIAEKNVSDDGGGVEVEEEIKVTVKQKKSTKSKKKKKDDLGDEENIVPATVNG